MGKKKGRPVITSGLKRFPPLDRMAAVRLKLSQLESARPRLGAADLNSSAPTSVFVREFAEFGLLVRETYKLLYEVAAFEEWWEGRNAVRQPVAMTDEERWKAALVMDAANEANHGRLELHVVSSLSHRHEFITNRGRVPVFPTCDRTFGLLKDGFRIAEGRPVP